MSSVTSHNLQGRALPTLNTHGTSTKTPKLLKLPFNLDPIALHLQWGLDSREGCSRVFLNMTLVSGAASGCLKNMTASYKLANCWTWFGNRHTVKLQGLITYINRLGIRMPIKYRKGGSVLAGEFTAAASSASVTNHLLRPEGQHYPESE